ncbi:glycosyltransferase family 2 protein (plasmid) [Methylocystis sp. MJC1]|uniref:glycosyltransferase family 2 protein n=1 Tax=Methylocystis sp. MJC1 TaxID=2654282 RepID=UPI0013EDBE07|nr:glycosyltransferase family 2 protein [Methylocystis sp. MJC1]KAF2988874.1 Chondroitin synthase [Methylocystis sp. MJC1]MBU6529108.1 glycosyltransferase family 2 protein [Methylocystis sp. MJC1]UZX14046.1 glycosyltransferase family 2 protein [Methylocystis sp. MJC1]
MELIFQVKINRFDQEFYGAYYEDLSGFSSGQLREHYRRHGAAEGRFKNFDEALQALERQHGPLPKDFSAAEYRRLNPELPHIEWWLKLHYLRLGRGEGRRYRSTDKNTSIEDLFSSFAKVTKTVNIRESGGVLQFTTDDPQIHFQFLPEVARNFVILDLSIKICPIDSEPGDPRVYFDYGDGFTEQNSVNLAQARKDVWLVHIPLPALAVGLRLDPASARRSIRLVEASISSTPIQKALISLYQTGDSYLSKEVQRIVEQVGFRLHSERVAQRERANSHSPDLQRRAYAMAAERAMHALNRNLTARQMQYRRWIEQYDTLSEKDFADMREQADSFPIKPLFSIILPTYNSNIKLLEEAINSLLTQTYQNFEVCIADDCSTKDEVRDFITKTGDKHERIRYVFRDENGHISECSNSAIRIARGDYLVLVDHDDVIPAHALWMVAYYINLYPNAKILYSDEDKLEEDGSRCDPYFKGNFDYFLMYVHNLVNHLGVYAAHLVRQVGGFRKGYEGSQDYDLVLRCAEACEPEDIIHIPYVLYHWRKALGSTATSADHKEYAILTARKAVNDHFARKGLPYLSVEGKFPWHSSIQISPNLSERSRKVAVIIPARDCVSNLVACLKSVDLARSKPHEILIVNNSREPGDLSFLRSYVSRNNRARLIDCPGEFNFSAINNCAAEMVESDIICFLNNDTEVLAEDWLERATAHFEIPDVGAVGAKLLYPDQTIQHFGFYLGSDLPEIAWHPHRGLAGDSPGLFGKASLIQQFSATTAACLFVRRNVLEEIGGFDETLRESYNDVDLCIRIREAGYRIIVDPAVLLLRKEAVMCGHDVSPEKAERLEREAAMMREKWGAQLDCDPFYNPNLSLSADFTPAFPPRITYPWKLPSKWGRERQESGLKSLRSFLNVDRLAKILNRLSFSVTASRWLRWK